MKSIKLLSKLIDHFQNAQTILILTGAGISAESGIPTFRGEDGYWSIGSKNYYPEEMATNYFFRKMPDELWKWYHHRQKVCMNAIPNQGHHTITKLEKWATENGKNFLLVTQNVDNLHIRAGTKNIIEIHGNIFKYRCSDLNQEHSMKLIDYKPNNNNIIPICTLCNSILRPHVLWFDEFYSEELFKAQTAIEFAFKTDFLFVIGTTLATTIPNRIVSIVYNLNKPLVEINPNPILTKYTDFIFIDSSSVVLPKLINKLNF